MGADLGALRALLDAHHVMHLATSGVDGPHCAALFFARHGDELVWLSADHVLHSRHLRASPRAAATVGPSTPPLGLIEGVQLSGEAEAAPDQAAYRRAWLARFPLAAPMVASARDHQFYRLRPSWARLIRTIAGVSQNREWSFGPEGWRGVEDTT